jgi:hypothetical protein
MQLLTGFADISALPGLKSPWAETLGDLHVCVTILDGTVDQNHPCFDSANLTQLQTLGSGISNSGFAS